LCQLRAIAQFVLNEKTEVNQWACGGAWACEHAVEILFAYGDRRSRQRRVFLLYDCGHDRFASPRGRWNLDTFDEDGSASQRSNCIRKQALLPPLCILCCTTDL
jgi:hypothetical protein